MIWGGIGMIFTCSDAAGQACSLPVGSICRGMGCRMTVDLKVIQIMVGDEGRQRTWST